MAANQTDHLRRRPFQSQQQQGTKKDKGKMMEPIKTMRMTQRGSRRTKIGIHASSSRNKGFSISRGCAIWMEIGMHLVQEESKSTSIFAITQTTHVGQRKMLSLS
jgi:hypothetical protein